MAKREVAFVKQSRNWRDEMEISRSDGDVEKVEQGGGLGRRQ